MGYVFMFKRRVELVGVKSKGGPKFDFLYGNPIWEGSVFLSYLRNSPITFAEIFTGWWAHVGRNLATIKKNQTDN